MTRRLLLVSIGPVQDFIATARRTRDLWFGSMLLSELSKAAAATLHREEPGCLVFPNPSDEADLTPGSPFLVVNRVAALVDDDAQGARCDELVENARAAVYRCWTGHVESKSVRDVVATLDEPAVTLFRRQVDASSIIEFEAVSVLAGEDFTDARRRADALLAARKNLRDFGPYQGAPRDKNSLDGARETVLPPERKRTRLRRSFGRAGPRVVRIGEQLDGVALVKRLAGGHVPFESTTQVAASPYLERLRALASGANDSRDDVRDAWRDLCDLIPGGTTHRDDPGAPIDASWLYPGRLEELTRLHEIADRASDIERAGRALDRAARVTCSERCLYYAVVVADGDRMGVLLDGQQTVDRCRQVSAALTTFTRDASDIASRHGAYLTYAGGDDVLALAPLHALTGFTRDLADSFSKRLQPFRRGQVVPSLSAGAAIIHHTTPLRDGLDLARQAEHRAKNGQPGEDPDQQRNALCIALSKRSGSTSWIRGRWDDVDTSTGSARTYDLSTRLESHAGLLRRRLMPDGLPYELRDLHLRMQSPGKTRGHDDPVDAVVRIEARRILERKRGAGGRITPADAARLLSPLQPPQASHAALNELAAELIVARLIADASTVAEGV